MSKNPDAMAWSGDEFLTPQMKPGDMDKFCESFVFYAQSLPGWGEPMSNKSIVGLSDAHEITVRCPHGMNVHAVLSAYEFISVQDLAGLAKEKWLWMVNFCASSHANQAYNAHAVYKKIMEAPKASSTPYDKIEFEFDSTAWNIAISNPSSSALTVDEIKKLWKDNDELIKILPSSFQPQKPSKGHLGGLLKLFPNITSGVECPVCRCPNLVADEIIHLNDMHNWTREQIADWLETLDVDLSIKPLKEEPWAS